MASSVGWLDYDETQRKNMLEVVDLFREKGTVDELGFGTVRDSFSNTMFPGVSVLHTRAKYLLFVPWTYSGLLSDSAAGGQAVRLGRSRELDLVMTLLATDDTEGVFGREAKRKLKRLPSAAYWAALQTF